LAKTERLRSPNRPAVLVLFNFHIPTEAICCDQEQAISAAFQFNLPSKLSDIKSKYAMMLHILVSLAQKMHNCLEGLQLVKEAIRILIAEPVHDIRELYAIILGPVADHIEFAGDIWEAIGKVQEFPYDLVFLDVGIPELDGLDGARVLNQEHPDLPVIVSSSIKLPARLAARLLSHPTNFLVSKPFDIKEIREIVLHACSLAAVRAEGRLSAHRPEPGTLAEAV